MSEKQVTRERRQAYIVYPVIEGAKDDQPELDFSHDETAGTEPIDVVSSQRPQIRPQRENSRAVPLPRFRRRILLQNPA